MIYPYSKQILEWWYYGFHPCKKMYPLLLIEKPKKLFLPSKFFQLHCDFLVTISFELILLRVIKKKLCGGRD